MGAGPAARRPQSLCLSRPRSPHPLPSQPGLDQWPTAMAGVSGPCPLWPVAPGSTGLLLGWGQHCDWARKQAGGRRQAVPRPASPRPVGTLEAGGQVQEI